MEVIYLFFLFHLICLFLILFHIIGNTTEEAVKLITDSMNLLVRKVMRPNNLNLCTLFVSRAMELNVTFMMTTSGLEKAGAMCGIRAAARMEKPIETLHPTSMPTAGPTPHSTPTPATLFSSTFVGVITMVMLVGLLRLNPTLATIILPKEKPKTGHLYDILIVVSDEEEAIIENIKHEDIVFLRRIAKCENDQTDAWMMNTSSEPLEARFEVQFYDHFDLFPITLCPTLVDSFSSSCSSGVDLKCSQVQPTPNHKKRASNG